MASSSLDEEPHWRPGFTLRGLLELPVGLSAH